MEKKTLYTEEDFKTWEQEQISADCYYMSPVKEVEPKSYPCVVVSFENINMNASKDDLFYVFVYQGDFIK